MDKDYQYRRPLIERVCESKLADWIGLTLMGICIFTPVIFVITVFIKFIGWILS